MAIKNKEMLEFFGITEENANAKRFALFSEIHEIVFHGKGGYTWDVVYEMPIWLRKFTFNKLKEFHDKEQEAADQQSNMMINKSKGDVSRPDIPSYNTKVSTK